MKNRTSDLLCLGQVALLIGIIVNFLMETENITPHDGALLLNEVYLGLIIFSFLLIMVTSFRSVKEIADLLTNSQKERQDGSLYIGIILGVFCCMAYLGKIHPGADSAWTGLSISGIWLVISHRKDIKAIHGMFWAIMTIAMIINVGSWSWLEGHHWRENLIMAGVVIVFLISVIVKGQQIKRAKKTKAVI
jgi:hypothetical protein